MLYVNANLEIKEFDLEFVKWWAENFGPEMGLALIIFLVTQGFVLYFFKTVIKTLQREIDRLADDNHRYRDIFLQQFGLDSDSINDITPSNDK